MSSGRRSAQRFWGLCCLSLLGACVTESLAICVNCGGPFTIVEMRGGYRVTLVAATGGTVWPVLIGCVYAIKPSFMRYLEQRIGMMKQQEGRMIRGSSEA